MLKLKVSEETERFFHFLYNYNAVLLVEVAQGARIALSVL